MTDQSKIPLPPRDKASQPSLIERAAGTFDFRTFQAPTGLPAAPAPALPPKTVPAQAETVAVTAPKVAPERARAAPPASPASPASALDGAPPVQQFRGKYYPIDRRHLREQCLIEPDGPVNGLLEEFRIVKRQLLLTAAESRAGRCAPHGERIMVCSAHPGDGKTFCAVNLALSIAAERDNEVLLVDADFAKPSVLSALGLPGGPGLMDALVDPGLMIEDYIYGTDIPGLFVLPAGNSTGADTEYVASSRTTHVLGRLTQHSPNRIVIFDSPPVLAASPASELASHVGQALMVVRADTTGEAALRDAVNILSGCEDIKLLLNCTRFSPTGRRFGSYYGYKQ
ncbi:capsular biosynthesis protein [Novosphingobium sp. Chol11]|uniref:capsular biosynthesis protein n=1 Tax=Novosphingobium sp. Chol11 TaxID=1385763 RepID=UPI0025EF2F42|nr:capsular biosynthesis protein [Novosphingobium sp. Chol11]